MRWTHAVSSIGCMEGAWDWTSTYTASIRKYGFYEILGCDFATVLGIGRMNDYERSHKMMPFAAPWVWNRSKVYIDQEERLSTLPMKHKRRRSDQPGHR